MFSSALAQAFSFGERKRCEERFSFLEASFTRRNRLLNVVIDERVEEAWLSDEAPG